MENQIESATFSNICHKSFTNAMENKTENATLSNTFVTNHLQILQAC